ncbi:cytochrome P450 [Saccharothrix isguenensis]
MSVDPYPNLAWLREHLPVSPLARGTWLVATYADARTHLADPRLSHDDRHSAHLAEHERHASRDLLDLDAPDHTRLRRVLAPAFAGVAVDRLAPAITRACHTALDRIAHDGHADLVRDYAVPVPIAVVHELLGAGDLDFGDPVALSDVMVRGSLTEPREPDAVAAALDHVGRIVAHADGGLTGELRRALADGGLRDEQELLSMVFTVLVAGTVTTSRLFGCALAELFGDTGRADRPRAAWPAFLDEVLRYHSPVQSSVLRHAREDVRIGDTTVPAGASVVVSLASANRDPAAFDRPDTFDPDRGSRGGLAFGHGPHRCLGDRLTRVEAGIALDVLFERLGPLRLERPVRWARGQMLRGPAELPVAFRATDEGERRGNR